MRRDIDAVEIKEPPIREFEKKSSCLKRGCVSGCGFLVLIVIVFLFLLQYNGPPRPKELKDLPDDLAKRIPLYDKKNINRIVLTSPNNQSRFAAQAIALPKAMAAAFFLWLEHRPSSGFAPSIWTQLLDSARKPETHERDIYEIEWTDLSAKPAFLQDYYQKAFEKAGYAVANVSLSDKVRQFSFAKDDVDGSLFIEDRGGREGTDETLLTVRVPSK